jgi:hypothetical protein
MLANVVVTILLFPNQIIIKLYDRPKKLTDRIGLKLDKTVRWQYDDRNDFQVMERVKILAVDTQLMPFKLCTKIVMAVQSNKSKITIRF